MTTADEGSPVLIIGTERSGSNLLRLMLDAHSRITVPHPPHFMRYLSPLADTYGDLTRQANRRRVAEDALGLLRRHIHPWPHPIDADTVARQAGPSLFGVVAAIYDRHRAALGKARWGCKSTFMVNHVAEVLAELPDARFVWLVREPADVAASAKRSVFGYCHPYRMAQLWRAEQEKARTALDRLGPDVVHLLRYEDLVSDPEQEVARLCRFLGEAPEPAMLRHHSSAEARRTAGLAEAWRNVGSPINTDRIGTHHTGLSETERLLVDKVTGPVKGELGYPVDPAAEGQPGPAAASVLLRSALLRARVEAQSVRRDRNFLLRQRRDGYVRWLRLKALVRKNFPNPAAAATRPRVPASGGSSQNGGTALPITRHDVTEHFAARAATYDRSSSWCTDDELGELVLTLAAPRSDHRVLDVACGTGLVSRLFAGRVAEVVGVDITEEMASQARPFLNRLVIAPAERLPFADGEFDTVVCRQGVQFMDLPEAIEEMVRVVRPGGLVLLINLCAYGPDDRADYFEILRLRNPVRRHFFLPDDLGEQLAKAGCDPVVSRRHVSVEDVDVWSDNGAIAQDRREAIREVYRNASARFRTLHQVHEADGRFTDHMLFVVACGAKPITTEEEPGGASE